MPALSTLGTFPELGYSELHGDKNIHQDKPQIIGDGRKHIVGTGPKCWVWGSDVQSPPTMTHTPLLKITSTSDSVNPETCDF